MTVTVTELSPPRPADDAGPPVACGWCGRPVHPADRCDLCRAGLACPRHRRPRRHRDAKYCGRGCQLAAYQALAARVRAENRAIRGRSEASFRGPDT